MREPDRQVSRIACVLEDRLEGEGRDVRSAVVGRVLHHGRVRAENCEGKQLTDWINISTNGTHPPILY